MRRRKRKSYSVVILLVAAALVGVLAGCYVSSKSSRDLTEPDNSVEYSDKQPKRERVGADAKPEIDSSKPRAEVTVTPDAPAQDMPEKPTNSAQAVTPGEIARVNDAGSSVALTFDAGASAAPTPDILDTLRRNGLRVTFFLTGKWIEKNPELVRRILDDGHEIGNHTYSHPDLTKLEDSQIIDELERMDAALRNTAGRGSRPWFRPPFGARNKHVLELVAREGYKSVYWTVDSWDSVKKGITPEEIKTRVLGKVDDGAIVLMHCGSDATAAALPDIIAELSKRGIRICTVSEMAGTPQ